LTLTLFTETPYKNGRQAEIPEIPQIPDSLPASTAVP